MLRRVMKVWATAEEVTKPTDADEAKRDAPADAIAVHVDSTDDQRDSETQQHDREREASYTEGNGETLGDGSTDRSEGAAFGEEGEGTDDDQQQDPQIAGVTLPDTRFA
jgi:hypothetical protein